MVFSLLSLASILNKNVEIIYTQISSWGILEQLQVVKASEKKGKKKLYVCNTHSEVLHSVKYNHS